jgi:exodeoxyribonuclease VII large subunit
MSARVWAVGELVREINATLAGGFGEVWVKGELSGVKVAASGHRYFQVKDSEGQLSCAMWAARADRLRFKLADGLAVLLRATLEVYPQRGSLQLIVAEVTPEGIGELQLAFEQLKAKLEGEGLFAAERKRPLPALPRRLGLVTSASGAAVRDVLKVLSRWEHLSVLLYPVRVQGKGAQGEIARAIRYLGQADRADLVLVVRGGGSLEDLWAFNEEIVARAIAACAVPVVSGVGHEVDFTIADFVADVRAATPTQAAELVVARLEAQQRRIEVAGQALHTLFRRTREHASLRLHALEGARGLARLPLRVRELEQRLGRLDRLPQLLRALVARRRHGAETAASRLYRWPVRFGAPRQRELVTAKLAVACERLRSTVGRGRLQIEARERALDALSPRRVLERGYSITTREGETTPVRDAAEVLTGTRLITTLARGKIRALSIGRLGEQGTLFEERRPVPGAQGTDEDTNGGGHPAPPTGKGSDR